MKAVDTSGETEKEERGDQEGKENEKEVVANDADVIESLAQKILVKFLPLLFSVLQNSNHY